MFSSMFATGTPLFISDHVRQLAETIQPGANPIYLRIAPGFGDQPLDCFHNVRQRVAKFGGEIVFGWAIWEWAGVLVEGEHHAVYAPPGGTEWRDITPSQNPTIQRRLFLPDQDATYDFENEGVRRDNVRLAISDSPAVALMLETAAERSRILNSIPGIGVVSTDLATMQRLDALEDRQRELEYQIAMTHTPPTVQCFCRSGKVFKVCHGV